MLIDELGKIVARETERQQSNAYLRNVLKEYLQVYVLNFVYTHPTYAASFIFTGGTCLKHCYDLPRLSEDLDFDLASPISTQAIFEEIQYYFHKTMLYPELSASLKQQGRQLLLKFPVLHRLGMAENTESDLLHIKLDLSQVESDQYRTETTFKTYYDFNYLVTHYDLPSLLSGKIRAVLTRNLFIGTDNREVIKGRDFFDLLWFVERQVVPNRAHLRALLGEDISAQDLHTRLSDKVGLATTKFQSDLRRDLLPFISNAGLIDRYVETYQDSWEKKSGYLGL